MADIGGTNARFALAGPDLRPKEERTLQTVDFPGLVEAAAAYLRGRKVQDAVFAVATPVESDFVKLTNSPWAFSIEATRIDLGLERLVAINDFVAQALAVPELAADEVEKLGDGAALA
ncbi:MAG: glucokinase, partial [Geminicoccaceae bacterium]